MILSVGSVFLFHMIFKMLDIIKSMYTNVRSKIKFNNRISADEFLCPLGVRQGESLSPFLFSMYLNDIEEHFILNDFKGIVCTCMLFTFENGVPLMR